MAWYVESSYNKGLAFMKVFNELMDTRVKDIKRSGSTNVKYTFTILGGDEKHSSFDTDLVYNVTYGKPSATVYRISGQEGEYAKYNGMSIRAKTATLIFGNETTGMHQPDRDHPIDAMLVYATVASTLMDYIKIKGKSFVQGVNFCTAHPSLKRPYMILSSLSEKRADLFWLNRIKDREVRSASFVLIRKSVFDEFRKEADKILADADTSNDDDVQDLI